MYLIINMPFVCFEKNENEDGTKAKACLRNRFTTTILLKIEWLTVRTPCQFQQKYNRNNLKALPQRVHVQETKPHI